MLFFDVFWLFFPCNSLVNCCFVCFLLLLVSYKGRNDVKVVFFAFVLRCCCEIKKHVFCVTTCCNTRKSRKSVFFACFAQNTVPLTMKKCQKTRVFRVFLLFFVFFARFLSLFFRFFFVFFCLCDRSFAFLMT